MLAWATPNTSNELKEVAKKREVWLSLLRLLPL